MNNNPRIPWLPPEHPEAKRPLEQTAESVSALAKESAPLMDAKVKSRQRDMLLTEAHKHMGSIAMPKPQPSRYQEIAHHVHRPWYFWLTSIGATVAVAMFALVVIPGLLSKQGSPSTTSTGTSFHQTLVQRMTIPEALAGDAFSMSAEHVDAAGTATNTSFVLQAKVDTTVDDVAKSLQISPSVDVNVEKTGDHEFKVTPKAPLSTGTVYRLAVATSVAKSDGSISQKDFSWAFQTKDDLRVLSTIPADGANGVPVATGIEMKMSLEGLVDATSSFSIVPAVKGTVKVNGRSLVFIPAKPLAPATRYEVTLKKGLKVGDSDVSLSQDQKIRFETEPKVYPYDASYKPQIMAGEYLEMRTGKDWQINPGWIDARFANTSVTVTGYALTMSEAKDVLGKRLAIPDWVQWSRLDFNEYKWVTGKQSSFSLQTTLLKGQDGQLGLSLPKQDQPGWYAINFQPDNGLSSWTLVQVTSRAVYVMADKDSMTLWALDASTSQPLSGLAAKSDTGSAATDNRGIARLPTPAFLTTSTQDAIQSAPVAFIDLSQNNESSFVAIRKSGNDIMNFSSSMQAPDTNTWDYLYTDRALYHPSDELFFAAFAQDRDSHNPPSQVTVQIKKSDWVEWMYGADRKIYQSMTLTPDAQGMVHGTFSWDSYASGYYLVTVLRDGKILSTRSFEIRQFAKPSYHIDVIPDKMRLMEGEKITGSIKVNFFDGAPVANAKFRLEGSAVFLSKYANSLSVTTNESGEASFSLPASTTRVTVSYPTDQSVPTSYVQPITVTPETGEEGAIQGNANVIIYPTEASLVIQPKTTDLAAHLDIKTLRVDLSSDTAEDKIWANRNVTLTYTPVWWEKVESGRVYDEVTKQTVPTYEYKQRFGDAVTRQLMTDGNGAVSFDWTMENEKMYTVKIETADDQGRSAVYTTSIGRGWYDHASYQDSTSQSAPQQSITSFFNSGPQLTFTPKNDTGEFDLNQSVKAQYQLDGQPLNTDQNSPVLYVLASRGIKDVGLADHADISFTMSDQYVPNVEIHAIAMIDGKFVPLELSAALRQSTRELHLQTKLDQDQYKPGDDVSVVVDVQNPDKSTAGQTTLVYAVVDKALLDITGDNAENALSALYGYVPDGIIYTAASQEPLAEKMFGGAEMGGGGGDAGSATIRKFFKDTAASGVIQTDGQGHATIKFRAPDNLTTWRIQVIAIDSKNLQAGSTSAYAKVSKNVYVEAVLPPRLLSGDKAVIQLRTVGRGLLSDTNVTYKLQSASLGIDQQIVGKANVPTYLDIPNLPVGHHALTVSVETPNGRDAIERSIDVVDTNFAKTTYTTLTAAPGLSLPESVEPETSIVVANGGKASLLNQAYELAFGWTGRADMRAAALIGQDMLRQMDIQDLPNVPPVSELQDATGGIKLLTYGSADIDVSAEIAATAPELVDQKLLAQFFYSIISQKDNSRTIYVDAYAGLAALHETGLAELKRLSLRTDLSSKEKIVIARGLVAAGDIDAARPLFEQLMTGAKEQDGMLVLTSVDNDSDRYQVEADLAALAAGLQDPRAASLQKYVESNWSNDSFPVLAKARYLKAMLPTLPARTVTMRYTTDGQTEQNLVLEKTDIAKTLILTKAERQNFRVTYVDGPATLSYLRSVPGKPASTPTLSITRRYDASPSLDQLHDGDLVTVTLIPEFKAGAKQGCYTVTDYLPGNTEPVLAWNDYWFWSDKITTPAAGGDRGSVSFLTCYAKDDKQDHSVNYKLRIVSRGSFKAESPLLQSLDFPSQATVGGDQMFTVK